MPRATIDDLRRDAAPAGLLNDLGDCLALILIEGEDEIGPGVEHAQHQHPPDTRPLAECVVVLRRLLLAGEAPPQIDGECEVVAPLGVDLDQRGIGR